MRALKEWASVVSALEDGVQTVLLRKGGIRDTASGFREESGTFFLFPTYEHQEAGHLKESRSKYAAHSASVSPPEGMVRITSVAEALGGADISPETARKLSDFHIWSDSYIEGRQKWMPEKPLRAVFLKVSVINPVEIPMSGEYSGCKSWLEIGSDFAGVSQVLDSERLSAELERFRGIVS